MSILEVKNYSFSYIKNDSSSKEVLHNLSFSIEKGTITGILGLSGCGKTTLCKALCGIIPHCCYGESKGTILVEKIDTHDLPLNKLACRIGFVMQNPEEQLVATTVEDEFAFAPENLTHSPLEIRKRVDDMLTLLGLSGLETADPSHLSGGQKQLLAIGSVLILDQDILVLDEPMSHLDESGKEILSKTLISLKNKGKTIVLVGHDPKSMEFADMWLLLSEGRVHTFAARESILGDPGFIENEVIAEILGVYS